MTSQVQQSESRHDEAGSKKETRTAGFGQTGPFLVFLRLGLTSFGGSIAHLGYFRQQFVERRKWLTEQTFADLVALCNFLPVTEEITKTQEAIKNTTGFTPTILRPPYGAITKRQRQWIENQFGLSVILWSVDPLDRALNVLDTSSLGKSSLIEMRAGQTIIDMTGIYIYKISMQEVEVGAGGKDT
jgi:Chromate transporter